MGFQRAPCLSEYSCLERFTSLYNSGIINGSFFTEDYYQTKGCFMKGENVYFCSGTMEDMAATVTGKKVRLWCTSEEVTDDGNILIRIDNSITKAPTYSPVTDNPTDSPTLSPTAPITFILGSPTTYAPKITEQSETSSPWPSINDDTSPTTIPTMTFLSSTSLVPTFDVSENVSLKSNDYSGGIIFQYLGQCCGLELDTDSCIVSKYIDNFMSENTNTRQRYLHAFDKTRLLRASSEMYDECDIPSVSEQEWLTGVKVSIGECERLGYEISDEEIDMITDIFIRIFANNDCWLSICDGSVASSRFFFNVQLDEAAECANVALDIDSCVYESMYNVILGVKTSGNHRRFLRQEAVAYLLTEVKSQCTAEGVNIELTDWSKTTDDLVAIFSSPQCWGQDGDRTLLDSIVGSEEMTSITFERSINHLNYSAGVFVAAGFVLMTIKLIVARRRKIDPRR
jgi:hypothetical protein